MLRIAVCDDDHYICSKLEQSILEFEATSSVKIEIELFYRGEDLLKFIQNEHSFDLIFLDIELGTTTGVEVGHKIRDEWNDYISKIVFISGASGYDRQLFSVHPFDFLEKPIDTKKLFRCLSVILQMQGLENTDFVYKTNRVFKKVPLKEILYFESNLRKIKIVSTGGTDFFISTIAEVQKELSSTFIAPHGSFLVNFSHISNISSRELTMTDGTVIVVSQRYLKAVRMAQIQFAKEKRDAYV